MIFFRINGNEKRRTEDDDRKCSDTDALRFPVGWGMVGHLEDILRHHFIIRTDEHLFSKKRVRVIKRHTDSVATDERQDDSLHRKSHREEKSRLSVRLLQINNFRARSGREVRCKL